MSFNFSDADVEAEQEFLRWFAAVQGTPIADEVTGLAAGTAVVGSVEPVAAPAAAPEGDRTYTAAELHGAKLDEAAKYGIPWSGLRDFLDLLTGDTPEEIAENAAKLYRVLGR